MIRAADKMNLTQLEQLCVFHVSTMVNADNVCAIYKEIHEKKPVVEPLVISQIHADIYLFKLLKALISVKI